MKDEASVIDSCASHPASQQQVAHSLLETLQFMIGGREVSGAMCVGMFLWDKRKPAAFVG